MTSTAVLVTVPIILPLLVAGITFLLSPFPSAQQALGVTVLGAVLIDAILLLVRVDSAGPQAVRVGGWSPTLGITLVADRFCALVLLVAVTVCLVVLLYAIGQGIAERYVENAPSIFHPTYLVLLAGIALVFLTGDLFTLFVGLEVMLMASYVLITLGATRERVRSGMTYIICSLVASITLLTAIGLTYAATGTVNLARLSLATPHLAEGTRTLLGALLLVALGIKAALVPLHWWLPDSYPTAPAPVTAIFAALLTKVAIYAIARTQTLLFPHQGPSTTLLLIAAATMLIGIAGALVQDDLNRSLSFALVSHIGFMLFGIGLWSVAGLTGTLLYLVHHITVQTALFLVSGLVERERGTVSLSRLGGVAVTTPALAALFLIPALSLSGVPPLAGFVGKLALLQAAVAPAGATRADAIGDAGAFGADANRLTPLVLTAVAILLLTSLLTLAAMTRIWMTVFWGEPAIPVPDQRPDDAVTVGTALPARLMWLATTLAILISLTVAATAGPLSAFSQRAAVDLTDHDTYRNTVLRNPASHTEETP